ncbi:MAG: hypothetical protein M3526_00900 [Actinomycetota bacterium]|nr:hypothetical protein [Actinomycetota bacterium]
MILLIGTAILQVLGILVVSGVAFALFPLDLGTSVLQNTFFLLVLLILLAVGTGLVVLGHRISKGGQLHETGVEPPVGGDR